MDNVLFLIERDSKTNEVFAFFRDKVFSNLPNGQLVLTCYSHIGQHSPCNIEYTHTCNQAAPEQYANLKRELEGLGYQLNILNKPL